MRPERQNGNAIKLGVVANEFFDLRLGRMGGFGWAARQVARCFQADPALGVEVVFLTNAADAGDGQPETTAHGARLVSFHGGRLENVRRLRAERIDLLLGIDYRPNYRFFYRALPRTPLVNWVRDPRTPTDVAKIKTLRLPTSAGEPEGAGAVDCTSLAGVVRASRLLSRPVLFASPVPRLAGKCEETYGVRPRELIFLPNIIEIDPGAELNRAELKSAELKSRRPRVVFLGRLDPIKRPWLFVELARHFPHVEFLFLGQSHFESSWPRAGESVPENVHFMGHVDGEDKARVLRSAWTLINTSIHEGLAISFLEALACETPILSCQNPGSVVARFGVYAGDFGGSGLDGVPRFVEGLKCLLEDESLRARLGREGRAWVAQTHNRARFLAAFGELRARAGLGVREAQAALA